VGVSDKLNALTVRAKETAGEHKGDLQKAAQQAKNLADQQTQGKYHDHIERVAAKVEAVLAKIPDRATGPIAADEPAPGDPPPEPEQP
jgi:hypothetical protein